MLEHDLVKIGLSEKEAKVYLAGLQLGDSSGSDISKKASLNRTTVYSVLDVLIKKGLASSYSSQEKTVFIMEPPSRLEDFLKSEAIDLKERNQLLSQKMDQLSAIDNRSKDKPVVRFYKGVEGIKAVVEDFLSSGSSFAYEVFDQRLFEKMFTDEEVIAIGKKRRSFCKDTRGIYITDEKNLTKSKEGVIIRLDESKWSFPADMMVYENKIYLVDFKTESGVIIENSSMSETLKNLFLYSCEKS